MGTLLPNKFMAPAIATSVDPSEIGSRDLSSFRVFSDALQTMRGVL